MEISIVLGIVSYIFLNLFKL